MSTIDTLKEQEAPPTPLFLFDCVLGSGATERWGTHAVTVGGNSYDARLIKNNLFDLRASSDEGLDGAPKITITLANADSHFSRNRKRDGISRGRRSRSGFFFTIWWRTQRRRRSAWCFGGWEIRPRRSPNRPFASVSPIG